MSSFSIPLSGLKSARTRQEVSSNNLANANTAGFKASRGDQASVSTGGSSIDAVTRNSGQGSLQRTGRGLDLALQGDGFFVLGEGGDRSFTRRGSFTVDGGGRLVDSVTGKFVQGESGRIQVGNPSDVQSLSVGERGRVTARLTDGGTRELGRLQVARFTNPSGLESGRGGLLRPTSNSGPARLGTPGEGGRGALVSGALEGSNVDLADQLIAQITSKRDFQTNARALRVKDEMLGSLLDTVG